MKIVAAINTNTFLVEMHEDEIVKAAGFSTTYDRGWELHNGQRNVKVGTVIHVSASYNYHRRVIEYQKEAGSAANTLRALADLIGGALPDVVIPPARDVPPGGDGWIIWIGTENGPELDPSVVVEVQTRDGGIDKARVERIWWKHSAPDDKNFGSDVIRYRVNGGAA